MARDRERYNEYLRKYMLKRYHRRRKEGIAALGGKCVRCGTTKRLQFDHRDPKRKKVEIAKRLAGLAESTWRKELKKCQLLCKTCHQRKTCEDRGFAYAAGGGVHGTPGSYRYCGCAVCRAAVSLRNKKYRQRRKQEMLKKQSAASPLRE